MLIELPPEETGVEVVRQVYATSQFLDIWIFELILYLCFDRALVETNYTRPTITSIVPFGTIFRGGAPFEAVLDANIDGRLSAGYWNRVLIISRTLEFDVQCTFSEELVFTAEGQSQEELNEQNRLECPD